MIFVQIFHILKKYWEVSIRKINFILIGGLLIAQSISAQEFIETTRPDSFQEFIPTGQVLSDSTGIKEVLTEPELVFVDTTIMVPLINFRAARISDIMAALAKQYRLNVWIDPQIDKTATIRLQNARLNDIFRFMTKEYSLQS